MANGGTILRHITRASSVHNWSGFGFVRSANYRRRDTCHGSRRFGWYCNLRASGHDGGSKEACAAAAGLLNTFTLGY